MSKEIKAINSLDDVESTFFSFGEHEKRDVVICRLETVLQFLESFPLAASERNKIEHLTTKCMTDYQIDSSHIVYKGFSKRLEFTYVPGISTLNIVPVSSVLQNDSISNKCPMETASKSRGVYDSDATDIVTMAVNRGTDGDAEFSDWSRLLQALTPIAEGCLASCTVLRRKTALSTTYQLCMDTVDGYPPDKSGRRQAGPLLRGVLLSAKKSKSAISNSQHLVYLDRAGSNGGEVKEKAAIGKLQRLAAGYYWGRLATEAAGFLDEGGGHGYINQKVWDGGDVSYLSGIGGNGCRRGMVCVNVMSGGLDRLIHVSAVASLDSPPAGANGTAPDGTGKQQHSQGQSPTGDQGSDHGSGSGGLGGDSRRRSRSSSGGGDVMDEEMLSVLMSITASRRTPAHANSKTALARRAPRSPCDAEVESMDCPDTLLALRSRTPRRSNSLLGPEGERPVYTVSFMGGNGRVRNPSRKNTALDRVGGACRLRNELDGGVGGQARSGQCIDTSLLEGTHGGMQMPIMQLGKMDEEVFSLDFTSISPFQAFCMALAIFDH